MQEASRYYIIQIYLIEMNGKITTELDYSWRLYYVTSARIPGEKAESIQIVKNIDALRTLGCDVELLAARRNNNFDLGGSTIEDEFSLKNKSRPRFLFAISLLHMFPPRIQPFFFLLMSFTFSISALLYVWRDKTTKKKIIFVRDYSLLRNIVNLMVFIRYPVIFEIHQLPRSTRTHMKSYKKCSCIVTISKYQKDLLREYGLHSDRVFCLRTSFDEKLFNDSVHSEINLRHKLKIPDADKVVMYAGSLAEWKATEFIIESSALVSKKIWYVFVGGSIEDIDRLRKSTRLNSARISFIGRIPHKVVPYYLSEADILLHHTKPPERSSDLWSFGPIKLLEYMAMGKPVIAPDLPWIREIIENRKNGITYDPSSPEDLARKIEETAADPFLCAALGKQAKLDVVQYSLAVRAKKMAEIIDRVSA